NTISQGISTADFYLAIPAAIVRFLESDSQTKILAKPQLRGAEGQKVSVNLGEEVPVPSTTFTPLATGGANANPLTSFTYRPLGVIVTMTPRVTYEGEIVLDLELENSARGSDVNIAGQNLPAFNSRKVTTRLRLRDGESNLIAGLLREDERRSLTGFPGLIRMPLLRQLFANNDTNIRQTDIVMLLTPRIIRTHNLSADDLTPIYIGTQSNMSLGGGPPPLIGGGEPLATEPPPAAGTAPTGTQPIVPGPPRVPPGSGPVPGTTSLPVPAPATPPSPFQPPPAVAQPAVPRDPVAPPDAPPAVTFQTPAQVSIAPPAEMRVGGGPYTLPLVVNGANRLSTLSVTVTFNPALVRVSAVTEGPLMRQGGATVTFTQQVDAASGRIDIAVTRAGDQTGVAGSGTVAALLVEPLAPGTSTLSMSGVGTIAGGGMAPLILLPANLTIK
ncbi:MAG: hypothetical protein ABR606_09575, partial [Vicinamibacterales bacterium]